MLKHYFERTYYGKVQRLQKALNFVYHELRHSEIMMLLRKKKITVNGARPPLDSVVNEGDKLSIFLPPSLIKIEVAYEDNNVFVAYKPRGIISDGEHSFEGLVKYKLGDNYKLVHRLDTNTEGLLLFAKNTAAYNDLVTATKKGQIKKYYRAKVFGIIKNSTFVLEHYLVKDTEKGLVKVYKSKFPNSIAVRSEGKVIEYGAEWTDIEVMIKEGKTHQIRAQLAEYGHFILGDSKYGIGEVNRRYNYKKQQLTAYKIIFDIDKSNNLYYLNSHIIEYNG